MPGGISRATATYRDGNLNMGDLVQLSGKKVYLVGTSQDGPMYEPIPISNAESMKKIFGDYKTESGNHTTLIRGLSEMLATGLKMQLYGVRIGNSKRAVLTLREKTTGCGKNYPTYVDTSLGTKASIALTIEARFPGSIYNDAILRTDWVDGMGTVISFYNPKTQITSSFTYSTDPLDSVDVHNVKELADALNANTNFRNYFVAYSDGIDAAFESWILPSASIYSAGYGKTWNTIVTNGELPKEWSEGWEYNENGSTFSIADRIYDVSRSDDETDMENPDTNGYEILSRGLISNKYPIKAYETATNNIHSVQSVYSIGYTNLKRLYSITKEVTVSTIPANTQGLRGNTIGAMNAYKTDGFQATKPNAMPVNEMNNYSERVNWASEFCMFHSNTTLSGSNIDVENAGYVEFDSFLPIDMSAYPEYWASKIFPELDDPIEKIIIGKWSNYNKVVFDSTGEYSAFYKLTDSTYKMPIEFSSQPIADGTNYIYPAVTRQGLQADSWITMSDLYFRLPPYLIQAEGTTKTYPYENMCIDSNLSNSVSGWTDGETVFDPDTAYGLFPYNWVDTIPTLIADYSRKVTSRHLYDAYFLGTLSSNYTAKPYVYDYATGDETATEQNNIIRLASHDSTYNLFDISYAVCGYEGTTTGHGRDINGLNTHKGTGEIGFGVTLTDAGSGVVTTEEGKIDYSARQIVLPAYGDGISMITELSIDGSGAITGLTDAVSGDIVVVNGRVFIVGVDGEDFVSNPTPTELGIDPIVEEAATLIRAGWETGTEATINYANAMHYAEMYAFDSDYKFYENYRRYSAAGETRAPYLEYSKDRGNTWHEINPKWISSFSWKNNGQLYPNDVENLNTFRITFVGGATIDPITFANYDDVALNANDVYSCWLFLWKRECAIDPTLVVKYPNVSDFFDSEYTTEAPVMSDEFWEEFIEWADDTVPPFLTRSDDNTYLSIDPSVAIRMTALTTKGTLNQVANKTYVDASNRADTYFVRNNTFIFAAPPTTPYIVSYLTRKDYVESVDYISDIDGTITFINPDKQPYDLEYNADTRFLIGVEYKYIPEWFSLSTAMSLVGGTNGIAMTTKEKYSELSAVLSRLTDDPPEVLVPVDFFIDETMMTSNTETGLEYQVNAGLLTTLANWLAGVNYNSYTTRAIVPIKNPVGTNYQQIEEWLERAITPSDDDPLRAANIRVSAESLPGSMFIDPCAMPMYFPMNGVNVPTTNQMVEAALLSHYSCNTPLYNIQKPSSHSAALQLKNTRADRLGRDGRYNTLLFNGSGYVVTNHITAAPKGSDFSSGFHRETVCTLVKIARDTFADYVGQLQDAQTMAAFDAALAIKLNNTGATESVTHQIRQTKAMKYQGVIDLDITVRIKGVFHDINITVQFTM